MSYYEIADEIVLGIDEDYISWSGKKYDFDEDDFRARIEEIDKDRKIKIFRNNFHQSNVPISNDTNERNFLSRKCTNGNLIIGIDSDEILVNPQDFKEWLDSQDNIIMDVNCHWYSVYKTFGSKLLITYPLEPAVIGTAKPNRYRKCRITNVRGIMSPLKVLHFSWGRTREEVIQKVTNWSHSKDFNLAEYMKIWDKVTLDNYEELKYFHPLKLRKWWQKLELFDLEKFELSKELLEEIEGLQV